MTGHDAAQAAIFYSWSGKTAEIASTLSEELGCALFRVEDIKRPNILCCLTAGVVRALSHKHAKLKEPLPDLSGFSEVTVLAPVWAGMPAPAFNNIIDAIPKGTRVNVILVSDSGKSSKDAAEACVDGRGLTLGEYRDIKV